MTSETATAIKACEIDATWRAIRVDAGSLTAVLKVAAKTVHLDFESRGQGWPGTTAYTDGEAEQHRQHRQVLEVAMREMARATKLINDRLDWLDEHTVIARDNERSRRLRLAPGCAAAPAGAIAAALAIAGAAVPAGGKVMTVTKYARRTELAADTDEFIERMTRPEVAYLAVSGLFEDKREWVFFGMSIEENNIAGGGFQFGRTTYLEAYLVRKIIIERLDANGVLVEVCPDGLDYFYRAVQLRKTLYQQPDVEAAGSTLRDRIKQVAAITAAPGERIAYRSYGVRLRAVK